MDSNTPANLRPGLQYPTLPTAVDRITIDYVRNIFDNLFWLRGQLDAIPAEVQSAAQTIASQLINQAITNITTIVNNTFNSSGLFLVGTHNTRLTTYGTASQPIGTGFFETDRNVIYVIVGPVKRWEFAAGLMLGIASSRPADLATSDSSFMFFATDTSTLSIWDGAAWIDISSTVSVAVDGALDGDGSIGNPLAVRVDNVTIIINGSNNLEVITYPRVIDTIALTGQTTDLGPTDFIDSDLAGTYRVNYYLETTNLDAAAGDVTLTISWTDDAGATNVSSVTLPLTSLGRTSGVFFVQNTAGNGVGALLTRGFLFGNLVTAGFLLTGLAASSISYTTAIGGIIGTASYALYMSLERLS